MDNYKNLTQSLKHYSEINQRLEKINKMAAKVREEKVGIEQVIMKEIKSLKLENKKLKIEGSHFFLGESKSTPPINIDLIEKVATDVLGTQATNKLLSEIKRYREMNVVKTSSLKRRAIRPKKRGARSIKNNQKDIKSQSLKKKMF